MRENFDGLCCTFTYGLAHYNISERTMTKDIFALFLGEISALRQEEEIIIIFDNAPANPLGLQTSMTCNHCPKKSLFLNITEMAISGLKSHIKRHLSEPSVQVQFSSHTAGTPDCIDTEWTFSCQSSSYRCPK